MSGPTYTYERPLSSLVAPSVGAQMRRDAENGAFEIGETEVGWAIRMDDDGRVVASKLIARGNNTQCPISAADALVGNWNAIAHSHPRYAMQPRPFPSEADIRVAMDCAAVGVGFVIVNWDVSDVVVVRYPTPRRISTPPRVWEFWRFTLYMHRSEKP